MTFNIGDIIQYFASQYWSDLPLLRQGIITAWVGASALVAPIDPRNCELLLDLTTGDPLPLDFVTPANVLASKADADAARDLAIATEMKGIRA